MDYDKILSPIVKKLYKKYGVNVIFQEKEFSFLLKKGECVVYKARTSTSRDYLYDIQIHKFGVIKHRRVMSNFKNCVFCKKCLTDYQLTCCDKYTHLECYLKNGTINCCNDLKENESNDAECIVCLDPSNTATKCNHTLCSECMTNIKKHNKKPLCPLCRRRINAPVLKNCIYTKYLGRIGIIIANIIYV